MERQVQLHSFYLYFVKTYRSLMLYVPLSIDELQEVVRKVGDVPLQVTKAYRLLPGREIGTHYYYHPLLLASSVFKRRITCSRKEFKEKYPYCKFHVSRDRYDNILLLSEDVSLKNFIEIFSKTLFHEHFGLVNCDFDLGTFLPEIRKGFLLRLRQSQNRFYLIQSEQAYIDEDGWCQPDKAPGRCHYCIAFTYRKLDQNQGEHAVKFRLLFRRLSNQEYFDMGAVADMGIVAWRQQLFYLELELCGYGIIDFPRFVRDKVVSVLGTVAAACEGVKFSTLVGNIVSFDGNVKIKDIFILLVKQLLQCDNFLFDNFDCAMIHSYVPKQSYVKELYGCVLDRIWSKNIDQTVLDIKVRLSSEEQQAEEALRWRMSLANLDEVTFFEQGLQRTLKGQVFRVIITMPYQKKGKDGVVVARDPTYMQKRIAKLKQLIAKTGLPVILSHDLFNRYYMILNESGGIFVLLHKLHLLSNLQYDIDSLSQMEQDWPKDISASRYLYNKDEVCVARSSILEHQLDMAVIQDQKIPGVSELHSFLFSAPRPVAKQEKKTKQEKKRTHEFGGSGRGACVKRMRPERIPARLQYYEHPDAEKLVYRYYLREHTDEYLEQEKQRLGVGSDKYNAVCDEIFARKQRLCQQKPSLCDRQTPPPEGVLDAYIVHPDFEFNAERVIAEKHPEEWKRYKCLAEPYLEVRESTIPGAGMGLFVVSKDELVVLRDIYIPYCGVIRPSNQADLEYPKITHVVSVGLGGVSQCGQVVEHMPADDRAQAYYANHMPKDGPFFALTEYPRDKQLRAIYIPHDPGLVVPPWTRVEIFTNYGKAAEHHHKIDPSLCKLPTQLFQSYEPDLQSDDVIAMQLPC